MKLPGVRRFENGALTSSENPALELQIAPEFKYIGNIEFPLKGVTLVDRHHFVEADADQQIQNMIIVQFEGVMPDQEGSYRWTPWSPVELAGMPFQHNPYLFSVKNSLKDDPENETTYTVKLLDERGYGYFDEWFMSRFARVVGAEKRYELIIFYIEDVAAQGMSLAQVSEDGGLREAYTYLGEEIGERALATFSILNQSD